GTRLSPSMSRSFVVHHRSFFGLSVRPTQLRMPLAKILPGLLEPTSYTRTAARFSSPPHAAPRPCSMSQAFTCSGFFLGISSATLDAEPTDTNILLPSALMTR